MEFIGSVAQSIPSGELIHWLQVTSTCYGPNYGRIFGRIKSVEIWGYFEGFGRVGENSGEVVVVVQIMVVLLGMGNFSDRIVTGLLLVKGQCIDPVVHHHPTVFVLDRRFDEVFVEGQAGDTGDVRNSQPLVPIHTDVIGRLARSSDVSTAIAMVRGNRLSRSITIACMGMRNRSGNLVPLDFGIEGD
jgi:hypothetical protein